MILDLLHEQAQDSAKEIAKEVRTILQAGINLDSMDELDLLKDKHVKARKTAEILYTIIAGGQVIVKRIPKKPVDYAIKCAMGLDWIDDGKHMNLTLDDLYIVAETTRTKVKFYKSEDCVTDWDEYNPDEDVQHA